MTSFWEVFITIPLFLTSPLAVFAIATGLLVPIFWVTADIVVARVYDYRETKLWYLLWTIPALAVYAWITFLAFLIINSINPLHW